MTYSQTPQNKPEQVGAHAAVRLAVAGRGLASRAAMRHAHGGQAIDRMESGPPGEHTALHCPAGDQALLLQHIANIPFGSFENRKTTFVEREPTHLFGGKFVNEPHL